VQGYKSESLRRQNSSHMPESNEGIPRGKYICNSADIPQNWEDIRIADMSELGDIPKEVV